MLHKATVLAYLLVSICVAVTVYRKPAYNWDLLPYVGSVVCLSESDPVKIHSVVYGEAAKELPPEAYTVFSGKDFDTSASENRHEGYRFDVAHNPYHFAEQLPFYSIKPLYVELIFLLHKFGLTPIQAARSISATSLGLVGIIIFVWTRAYVRAALSAVLSTFFLLSPPIYNSGRLTTPDAVSALVVICALYLLFEKGQTLPGLMLLCMSPFIRTDNVIVAIVVISYLGMTSRASLRIKSSYAATLIALVLISVLAINYFSGNYGWLMLFQHSFVSPVSNPAESPVHVSLRNYLFALYSNVEGKALINSSLFLFTFFGLVDFVSLKPAQKIRDLLSLTALAFVLRIFIFPMMEDRYFIVAYVVVAVVAISIVSGHAAAGPAAGHEGMKEQVVSEQDL